MSNTTPFDASTAMEEMDAGCFLDYVGRSIQDTAKAVVGQEDANKKKGKVVITLEFDKITNSQQVNVSHDIKFDYPTETGRRAENHKRSTPMYVYVNGGISVLPENQTDMFMRRKNAETE